MRVFASDCANGMTGPGAITAEPKTRPERVMSTRTIPLRLHVASSSDREARNRPLVLMAAAPPDCIGAKRLRNSVFDVSQRRVEGM
jgi:hypothetical protein